MFPVHTHFTREVSVRTVAVVGHSANLHPESVVLYESRSGQKHTQFLIHLAVFASMYHSLRIIVEFSKEFDKVSSSL